LRCEGIQTRSRITVVERQHGGRHCPHPAVQLRYCAYTECFQWKLGSWKPCQTEASLTNFSFIFTSFAKLRFSGAGESWSPKMGWMGSDAVWNTESCFGTHYILSRRL